MDMDDAELTPDQLYMAQIAYVTALMQSAKGSRPRFEDFVLSGLHNTEEKKPATPEQQAANSKAYWTQFLMSAYANKKQVNKDKEVKHGK